MYVLQTPSGDYIAEELELKEGHYYIPIDKLYCVHIQPSGVQGIPPKIQVSKFIKSNFYQPKEGSNYVISSSIVAGRFEIDENSPFYKTVVQVRSNIKIVSA